MRCIVFIAIAALPCFAAEDDGDWEFLKGRIPDEKAMESFIGNREWTESFRFAPAAFKFIEGAEKVTVFEGLPHQNQEMELYEQERTRVDETTISGFSFYPQPQDLKEKDLTAMRELMTDGNGLRPFLHLKRCGGFHPDYAIRFTKGEEHCDLLLCFGCGDARIFHNGKVIHCHIHGWEKLLAPYTKLRPKGG